MTTHANECMTSTKYNTDLSPLFTSIIQVASELIIQFDSFADIMQRISKSKKAGNDDKRNLITKTGLQRRITFSKLIIKQWPNSGRVTHIRRIRSI